MSLATNLKKKLQLGMYQSEADRKLARIIMFNLAKKLGEDICYRCFKRIERLEEFSVDHKKPWLDVSVKLFWDIDNIAFSHRKCNTSVRRSRNGSGKTNKQRFADWYNIPVNRERWNRQARERYALKKMAASANG